MPGIRTSTRSMQPALLAITLLFGGTIARAASCSDQFADLEQFKGILGATVTITQANGTVSYAKFYSLLHNASITGPTGGATPSRFTGKAGQFFNDRDPKQPFPANKQDRLGIEIAKNGSDVVVTFTLFSWNNGKVGFTASCDGGIMHGFSNAAYYAISFQKSSQ